MPCRKNTKKGFPLKQSFQTLFPLLHPLKRPKETDNKDMENL